MQRSQARPTSVARSTLLALLLATMVSLPAWAQGRRCGAPPRMGVPPQFGVPADCGYWTNAPQTEYEPGAGCVYDIQVVFHVIQDESGQGFVSAETLQDQIDVLNEDFLALPGTPGGPGTNAKIRFHLATTDPGGNPTTGITYTMNDRWFDDRGNYGDVLTWDSNRYMNIYTNEASGNYGYVNGFPSQGDFVGSPDDYVVINWKTVGREGTPWWDGNMGRTGTHEAGHYVGLWHTFEGGCEDPSDCYATGDAICDTNPEAESTDWCDEPKVSCGNDDPIHNYMDYTADTCLWEFTPEQVNRARCTLEHWRLNVYAVYCGEAACDTDDDGTGDGLDACCDNGTDDDGDGDTDCDDTDCASATPCGAMTEDCGNGIDDDGDLEVDCEDPDCLVDDLLDCDGDGTANGVDCQPANPLVALPPGPVDMLLVTNPGNGDAQLAWSGVVDATNYDVLSGLLSELWAGRIGTETGSCSPAGDDVTSPYSDARRPAPGVSDGHWYVVRAQNPCPGSYGLESDLDERAPPAAADCR